MYVRLTSGARTQAGVVASLAPRNRTAAPPEYARGNSKINARRGYLRTRTRDRQNVFRIMPLNVILYTHTLTVYT